MWFLASVNLLYLFFSVLIMIFLLTSLYYPFSDADPSPFFMDKNVQSLLKKLTGFDKQKVFRHRRTMQRTDPPKYVFLTDEQLKEVRFEILTQFILYATTWWVLTYQLYISVYDKQQPLCCLKIYYIIKLIHIPCNLALQYRDLLHI